MTTSETMKKAIEMLTALEVAYDAVKQENTQLKNQLQDIRTAIGAAEQKTALARSQANAASYIKAKAAKPSKPSKPTDSKRGRKFLFSDAQVLAIREQHNKGASVLALAKEHKVSPPTIYNALTRGLSTPIKASTNGAGAGKH